VSFISNAFAQGATGGGVESQLMSFLPLILMFAVLYFIIQKASVTTILPKGTIKSL